MKIEETFETAFQHHQKNNFKIAKKFYQKILVKEPKHFQSIFYLGTLYIQTKKFNEAKSFYEKAIQIDSSHASSHHNLGAILQELGNLKKAIVCYEKVIKIDPNYASAYSNLGKIFNEIGEYKKAIDCCDKAIKINPNFASAYNNFGNALNKLKKYESAITYYKKALEIDPKYVMANYNLGKIFRKKKNYLEAINFFQKINTASSRAELLECIYFSNNLSKYKIFLKELSVEDPLNLRVSTMATYVSKKESILNIYPFCRNPLQYIFIGNLKNELNLKKEFIFNFLKKLNKIKSVWEPTSNTTKGGYQTLGNLFESEDVDILKLKKIIEQKIKNYRKIHKNSNDLFVKKWPIKSKFRGWHVKLFQQGHQKSHIHPNGWLSGVIYLKMPNLLKGDEGSIEFTLEGYDYTHDKNLPKFIHNPKNFDIALFPSSLFHRTIPFSSKEDRQVIAFDLVPSSTI